MRPSLLVMSLLAFHLLLSAVQGVRVMKSSVKHEIIQENAVTETDNNGVICREGHCSSGKNRKLVTSITATTSTTKTTSENLDNGANQVGGKRENLSVSSSPAPGVIGRKIEPRKYEDMRDMNEMDYSPATRKPPIHN